MDPIVVLVKRLRKVVHMVEHIRQNVLVDNLLKLSSTRLIRSQCRYSEPRVHVISLILM